LRINQENQPKTSTNNVLMMLSLLSVS